MGELSVYRRSNGVEAEREQVLVEVPTLRGKDQRLDASGFGCLGERRDRRLACGIGIARDVEPTERWRELKSSEMAG